MDSWVVANQNLTNQNIDLTEKIIFYENIINENKNQITLLNNKIKSISLENNILKNQKCESIKLKSILEK